MIFLLKNEKFRKFSKMSYFSNFTKICRLLKPYVCKRKSIIDQLPKSHFCIRKSSDGIGKLLALPVSSTSPAGGNLVDGLPPASSNTETQSIRRTRHPRTFMNLIIAFVFLREFCIMSCWFALLTLKVLY